MTLRLVSDASRDAEPGVDSNLVALVEGVKAGKREAQLSLWKMFAPMVYRMSQRALRPGSDVEDLVQDVFIAAFRDVRSLRDPTALKSYVGAIAANLIRRELGRRRRRRWFESSDTIAHPEPIREPASSATFALRRLYDVLDRFKPTDRMVFVLREIEGHSLDEVCALLKLSRATVKRKSAHVQARLSKHLKEDPFLVDYLPTVGGQAND